jgi:glutathione S-transferase
MIELLQFAPALGLMNASPFCMKAEVFLRLCGLPYRCVSASPVRAPKGKLPVLRDDGRLIADSHAIIEHLQRQHAERLPPALRRGVQGSQLALKRMLEEHTYFANLWLRWIDDAGWAVTAPAFFSDVPAPLRAVLAPLVRRKIRRDLMGQGLGRHDPQDIAARACADLDAAQVMLGAQPFFGGDEPTALDATTYAFVANLLWAPLENAVRAHLQAQAPLVAYCERMRDRVGQ